MEAPLRPRGRLSWESRSPSNPDTQSLASVSWGLGVVFLLSGKKANMFSCKEKLEKFRKTTGMEHQAGGRRGWRQPSMSGQVDVEN